ncbi:hypothetical protein TIFTF001_042848 [Ficus carica]|uniref:Uncharacterized protein n=1 Tax=Ficus carica TaxID=3494 RepID=A0AA87YUX1_FICCA|nr:hypothetical protein TIFTF001_042848 [Ficus carica]
MELENSREDTLVKRSSDSGIQVLSPLMVEDLFPVVPLQEIPPQEAEVDAEGNGVDPADFMAAPEDQPEYPPVIIIDSDDDEEDAEEEVEKQ